MVTCSSGTVVNACKIELAEHVFPLLIKPTGLPYLFLAEDVGRFLRRFWQTSNVTRL